MMYERKAASAADRAMFCIADLIDEITEGVFGEGDELNFDELQKAAAAAIETAKEESE